MHKRNRTIKQGDLISELYEEVSKQTTNKKLQTALVYLALIEMKVSGSPATRRFPDFTPILTSPVRKQLPVLLTK